MTNVISPKEDLALEKLSNPQTLLIALQKLRQSVMREGQEIFSQWRSLIHRPVFKSSALNLAYYLALRRHDLRTLQTALMPWGLSSLGRIEARVLPNLDAVIATLGAICGEDPAKLPPHPRLGAFFAGDRLLQQHTEDVFGETRRHRRVRIMVTLPTAAANDGEFVRDLLRRGCDCVRINCAHDSADIWAAMIANLRQAEMETGHHCKILMDLGGPKPRIEQIFAPDSNKQRLFVGDYLLITRTSPPTANPTCFQASCTIPQVLDQLQVGATVWIDDGRIGAGVESINSEGVLLTITHARPQGEKLRADKGINFPDTVLNLSPLTQKDLQDLDFIATHADIVGYSFVQTAAGSMSTL
ncbi:pyruvate kinase [Microseira wollei NIES-4236]|uniref:pyruvate kinase n=1 Tax=Microseira wollei NIES-4236 TaxID=2530354 RepID=A0AAV3XFH0_9CYAN|nr:pyruvate kinase [Microseira wollei]GET39446.1 pyruvate kinase [Microseira wollei NIES-4236]